MDLELSGKRAVVTGAANGIGVAVAETLQAEGMQVAMLDLDARTGTKAAARLDSSSTGARFFTCDLRDRLQLARVADEACAWLGGLDVLVNNAGIQEYGNAVDTTEEQWDRVLAVNLPRGFLMSQPCIPRILDALPRAVPNIP